MRTRILAAAAALSLALGGSFPAFETEKPAGTDAPQVVREILTEPPKIRLSDSLSSTLNSFSVSSGNYEWYCGDGGEMRGVIACGSAPLNEAVSESAEKLEVPEYNRLDAVPYRLSADVQPDEITLIRWDAADIGKTEAEAEEEKVYDEEPFLLELNGGKVYQVTAEWKEEKQEERGYYGTAEYVFVTE